MTNSTGSSVDSFKAENYTKILTFRQMVSGCRLVGRLVGCLVGWLAGWFLVARILTEKNILNLETGHVTVQIAEIYR